MDTVPPAPPILPSSRGNQALRTDPTPCPQHAALPFNMNPPIQEINSSPEAVHDAPHESHGQEGSPSDGAEKYHPVQETNPAPQTLVASQIPVQQDEQTTRMDPSGQDHLV